MGKRPKFIMACITSNNYTATYGKEKVGIDDYSFYFFYPNATVSNATSLLTLFNRESTQRTLGNYLFIDDHSNSNLFSSTISFRTLTKINLRSWFCIGVHCNNCQFLDVCFFLGRKSNGKVA